MPRLGISIYPEHARKEDTMAYVKQAADLGFKRIFTCLLSAEGNVDEIVAMFADINAYAQSLGMEVIIDVAPAIFDKFNITYEDLSFFARLNVTGIRLDEGFDGQKEAMMTFNPHGLKIEFNASQYTKYIDNIISYKPNMDNMITCHNFYPQKYTGLGYELFMKCNEAIKAKQMRTAAFITSQEENTFGPWPVNEGLCTLEMHRFLPIDLQARHLFATQKIDDVLIGNAFASKAELEAIAKVDPAKLTFKITMEPNVSDVEKEIIFNFAHHVRGDMSEYMARSTFPRITYAAADIPAGNTRDLKRGDIVVLNNEYGRYKGELHIIMKDMPNDGNKNVVGVLSQQEQILMEFIEPFRPFAIIQ
ncbi:MAG: DUF871 domain-containing protein [Erysipelotrichaceae bacterium]